MNLKAFSGILSLLLMPLVSLAQGDQVYVDSVLIALDHAKSDTVRLEINRELGFYYQDTRADIAIGYHQERLVLSKKLNFSLWEADAYQQVGYCYYRYLNFSSSYESYMNGLNVLENPSRAIDEWGYQNFSFSKTPEDARLSIVGMIHFEMSRLFFASRSFDQVLSHLRQAYRIGETLKNKKILSLSSRDIGYYYYQNNQPDSAYHYYQLSLNYHKGSPYQILIGSLYLFVSQYYLGEKNYDSAHVYCNKALVSSNKDYKTGTLINAQLLKGQIFKRTGNIDSALYYSQKVIENSGSPNTRDRLAAGYILGSSLYKIMKKDELAYHYLERGKILSDSLNDVYNAKLLQFQRLGFDEKLQLKELEKEREITKSRMRIYGLLLGLGIFVLVALLLYRNNLVKQKTNIVLNATLDNLKSTQSQLIQSEKMASLGELTAGIAHEIQNPLNFVNNFSEVNKELAEELEGEVDKGNTLEVKALARDIKENQEKILHHGKRADAIVKGMLQHSRSSSGVKEPTDINALADEYLRLAYHGLRAKDKSFNATMKTDFDESIGSINVVSQDMGRVILNLITNAFYVVNEKAKIQDSSYEPQVIVSTKRLDSKIEVRVKDNGNGIPDSIKEKIFQPFFTTKPTGQGTGLGLSLSYDIVKAHGGELKVETKEGEGSIFSIHLPIV